MAFKVDMESSIFETDLIRASKNKNRAQRAVPWVVGERVEVSHPGELTSCITGRLSYRRVTIVTKM